MQKLSASEIVQFQTVYRVEIMRMQRGKSTEQSYIVNWNRQLDLGSLSGSWIYVLEHLLPKTESYVTL
jgi:hypothetical protein